MNTNNTLKKSDEPTKGKPWHSQLSPFLPKIASWIADGKTIREIQTLLQEEGLTVAHSTIYRFILRRSKPRKVNLAVDPTWLGTAVPATQTSPKLESPEEARAARKRDLAALASRGRSTVTEVQATPEEIALAEKCANDPFYDPARENK